MKLFRSGSAKLTHEEYEVYKRYLLLDLFHIRPWEYNDDHEVYKEDIADMINLKKLHNEAEQYNMKKAEWRADVQSRLARQ